jgi:hypothetical protein
MRRFRGYVPLALMLAVVVVLWWVLSGHETPTGQPPLAHLEHTTLERLQNDFNRNADAVRVIVLLSPT